MSGILVALVVGADCRPNSLEQFWIWSKLFLPNGKQFHLPGLAAICWEIWLARNNLCFEGKLTRSPTEIICSASSFLTYWAGLQNEADQKLLEEGAEALKKTALQFHPHEAPRDDGGMVLLQ
uniref:Uncharacterized protein n=1 Tax=Setaria viridis TaxID=4556 RepID=A0A4U6U573_SETVI|nr:hypothetical protein SEVIR_6G096500v2 [Setaria viridis]